MWNGASRAVGLWDDLKDRLKQPALLLSDEMKQRLCIARLLTIEPEIILLDEPCSALDPIATMRIEELMIELKKDYTILIVTHNMQQAARVSDYTGFMLLGDLVEFGKTEQIFTAPKGREDRGIYNGPVRIEAAFALFAPPAQRPRAQELFRRMSCHEYF